MSTVFKTYEDARESIRKNKFAYTEWNKTRHEAVTATAPHNSEAYLDDYARIATFLCNEGKFLGAMDRVSAKIWMAYNELAPTDKNKFTRAMGLVARRYGFDFQNRFVLATATATAPIGIMLIGGDEQLGYMLRNRLFWKDSMDLRHGEHTHSLQWLAIAEGAGTANGVAALYAEAGNYRASGAADTDGVRSLLMWQWLADCFPTDMAGIGNGKQFKGTRETLVSDSFRAPQYIMDKLMLGDPKSHKRQFVATYLHLRYKNRNWLGMEGKKVVSMQGVHLPTYAKGKAAASAWKASPSSPDARMLRDAPAYTGTAASAPAGTSMRFHGIDGFLYQSQD